MAKILFVTEEFPPDAGGVGVSSERVTRNLSEAGHDLRIVTFDASRTLESADYSVTSCLGTIVVERIGPFFIRQPKIDASRLSEKVKATYRRRAFDQMVKIATPYEPDIIISFNAVNAGLLATYLARELEIPHVVSVRGVDVGRNIFSFTELSALRTIGEGSAKIVCVNEHLQRRLLLAFPDFRGKSCVIKNAVEMPALEPLVNAQEKLKEWADGSMIVVFIGTPREKKGIDALLRAISSLQGKIPVKLLIVGSAVKSPDPTCQAICTELVNKNALLITGHLPRSHALWVAAQGDVIAMPSLEDGMANGLLEGMALGLCPVVTDIFSDVVTKESALFVARGDSESLAHALAMCAKAPELRSSLGKAAKAIIDHNHRPAREAADWQTLIASVIEMR